jgi:hypothetical protein
LPNGETDELCSFRRSKSRIEFESRSAYGAARATSQSRPALNERRTVNETPSRILATTFCFSHGGHAGDQVWGLSKTAPVHRWFYRNVYRKSTGMDLDNGNKHSSAAA